MIKRGSMIAIRMMLITPAASCTADIASGFVNIMIKYVLPKKILWHRHIIEAMMESCPRIGIKVFIAFDPFFNVAIYITTTNNAVPIVPRRNILSM